MKKYLGLFLVVLAVLTAFALLPHTASATALTATSTTVRSTNATPTLAKVGDTVTFYLGLSGLVAATTTPQIKITSLGYTMASTSMTIGGTRASWSFATTSKASWTSGAPTFFIGFTGSAGEATSTISEADASVSNLTFDQTAPTDFSASMDAYVNNDASTTASFTFSRAQVGATYLAYLGNGTASSSVKSGTISTATDEVTGIDLSALDDGTLALDLTLTDPAGNKSATTTVAAISILDTTAPSDPTASPSEGTYASAQSVTLSSTGSNSIYYSIDGSMPACPSTGTHYGSAIRVTSSREIQAVGCDTAGNSSAVASFSYDVGSSSGGGHGGGGGGGNRPKPVQVPANPQPNPHALLNASPMAVFNRLLVLGSAGDDVLNLQKFLNGLGFTVTLAGDGSLGRETTTFGPATRSALIKYQLAKGIIQTMADDGAGQVGPKTRAALNGVAAPTVDTQTLISSLQNQINQLMTQLKQLQAAAH